MPYLTESIYISFAYLTDIYHDTKKAPWHTFKRYAKGLMIYINDILMLPCNG